MARIGIGVGDEFPVEEGRPSPETGESDKPDDICRRWREQAREHQREWRGRRPDWHYPSTRRLWPALIIIGGIALLIAIISHFFYFFLGAAVLAILYFVHRHHHDDMWEMHPDPRASSDKT